MSLPSSPLFENIRSPCPSGTASPVETQDSLSSSLMGSPLGLRNISSLPRLSTGTPKPSITPSLLDSPLSRKLQFPQHSRYYFEDDMAVFLVEDCLFRVHRYHLDRESEVFPKGTSSNRTPIELLGVKRTEFESLLDFLYDGMHNETTPTLSAWTSLLSISTHFEMKRIRSRAIAEILSFRPRIDPVDQVVLAVRHDIPEWFPLGYAALCQREEAIEIEEARKLGLETTVMLAKAREMVRKNGGAVAVQTPVATGFAFGRVPNQTHRHTQVQANQDLEPFNAALVSRVVNDIFWPPPVLPDLEDSTSDAAGGEAKDAQTENTKSASLDEGVSGISNAEWPSDSPPPAPSWISNHVGTLSPERWDTWLGQPLQPKEAFPISPEPIEVMPIPDTSAKISPFPQAGVPRKSATNKKKTKGGK
ncbi:hypothetical protein PILCRDRAFT_457556 [Piloderma croceum F 1598]|uniref:BTB domain-containing protein n=1 Tax=Piloderma croceum (strain F 1598) TaxID=765440 RepID=A0A0C3BZN3_PILCF|nr:hypothetical protein PILCRDRAFT_457556 [Piloderma croceum F 1598]